MEVRLIETDYEGKGRIVLESDEPLSCELCGKPIANQEIAYYCPDLEVVICQKCIGKHTTDYAKLMRIKGIKEHIDLCVRIKYPNKIQIEGENA